MAGIGCRRVRLRGETDGGLRELDEIFFGGGDLLGRSSQLHHDEFPLRFKNRSEEESLRKILGGATRGSSPQSALETNEGECASGAFFYFGLGSGGRGELGGPAIEIGLDGATFA